MLTSLRRGMDVSQFCSATRLLIVAGKGGVGKTTVTAALARMAARAGLKALIVEVEGKSGIGNVFGHDELLGYEEVTLGERLRARTLTPDDALLEYLEEHGMKRVSKRLASSGALDVVSTAVPGIKDILVLGKVKQLERAAAADVIVLDAPAAGHAVTFLTSAQGLLDAARVGPIRAQAQDVVDLLSDPTRRDQIERVAEEIRALPGTVAVVSPVTALEFTANLVEGGPAGPAGQMLVRARERDPDPEAQQIRLQDSLATLERFEAAGEQSFDNPDWVEFLLYDNRGEIRKSLRPFFPTSGTPRWSPACRATPRSRTRA